MQQFQVIRRDLPPVSARLITGSDDVELWSTQEKWDSVLRGHRIVVSTHAILSDALSHGFVTMSRLGLLIFDEGMNENIASKIRDGAGH
jgi:RecG-like helicase